MARGRNRKSPTGRAERPGVLPSEARRLIDSGKAPAGLIVRGALAWTKPGAPLRLPENLSCFALDLTGQPLTGLPAGLSVRFKLCLRNCARLTALPAGLKAGSLDLSGCTALTALPENFEATFLDISGCLRLKGWPRSASLALGRLRARDCTGLTQLPDWLKHISQLDLTGCRQIEELPDGLVVTSWIDLAGTSIRVLPRSLRGTALRWRGVPIDERIAFRPEEIASEEVLAERNAELRRVLLERMGFERFLSQARAEVVDADRDPGGERRLLRVPLEGDEPLVCVSVRCPSTGRQYIIRVPPNMETCRQAVAWTAGFDDADQYRPQIET